MAFNKLLLLLILIIIIHPFLCNVILRALSKIEKFFLKVGARQTTVSSNTQNVEPTTSVREKKTKRRQERSECPLCHGFQWLMPRSWSATALCSRSRASPKQADTNAESWGAFMTDKHKELCRAHLTSLTSSLTEVRYSRGGLAVVTSSPSSEFSSLPFILTKHFYMEFLLECQHS